MSVDLTPDLTPDLTEYGDYKYHKWLYIAPVDYPRLMSWKAGKGTIGIGRKEIATQKTDKDTVNYRLPAGWSATVEDTKLKLVVERNPGDSEHVRSVEEETA